MKGFLKSRITFLILGMLWLLPGLLCAQSIQMTPQLERQLDTFVSNQMKVDRIPGLSIGFYQGKNFWANGYGFADLENRTPARANSAYRLASNTKSMTAVAILQLAEQGKLKLDDQVQKYVPYFPWKHWPVTIRQLLGHLGGISHYKDYDLEGHIKEHKYTRDAIAIFAPFDLVAEPQTRFQYSSYGYNLLGAVIEGAAKTSYADYLTKHLWIPLGMKDTRMDDPLELIPNRVRGYQLVFGELKNSEFVDISSRFAAGGTRSTVPDLLKYAEGLANDRVLSRRSRDEMETSLVLQDGHFTDYGMGWVIQPVNGHFMAYHTGGQPETRTLLIRFPTMNFAIALAYNLEGGNLRLFGRRFYQLLTDEAWNVALYTGNRYDEQLYRALWESFNYGMAEFDRFGKRKLQENAKVQQAFAYFNRVVNRDSLEKDFKRFSKALRDGRHPVAAEAFVRVGAFMTQQLLKSRGTSGLDIYHKNGALPFFWDYISLYRSDPSFPEEYRFTPAIEKMVEKWSKEWEEIWTPELRRLHIAVYNHPDAILTRLKKQFAGSTIYPYYSSDFARVIQDLLKEKQTFRALKIGQELAQLYPQQALPQVLLALCHTMQGDSVQALAALQEARKAALGKKESRASGLNRQARWLFNWNFLAEAESFLRTALKVFPDNGTLWDTLGEIHLERSRRAFKKALRYNPTREHPWKMLKKID